MSLGRDQMKINERAVRSVLVVTLLVWLGVSTHQGAMADELANADVSNVEAVNGEAWLKRMVNAMQTQNYRGVFVYSRGSVSSSMKVIHRYKEGVDRERLVQLDGEMGEILRTGDEVICVLPGNRVVSLEQNIPTGPFAGAFSRTLMPKKDNYMISIKGEDRVAGHLAVKIAVMAKDGYRYNYLLWLEKTTGLLLKSTLIDLNGQVLERFHYTSLELAADITDAELEPSRAGEVFSHETVPAVKASSDWPDNMGWKVDWLPQGFMQVNKVITDNRADNGEVNQGNIQVFSDGLASFSVFIEKPGKGNMPEGASVVGATVAYAHRLKWKNHDYMVTVVGEVPVTTAMKVAETVVPEMH